MRQLGARSVAYGLARRRCRAVLTPDMIKEIQAAVTTL